MDTAYDMIKSGNPIVVKATSIMGSSIGHGAKRFSCPVCGEYVAFVNPTKKTKYFRHPNTTEETALCELRVELNTYSINYCELKGSPLYLSMESDGSFKLYIGFCGLGKDLSVCENKRTKINVMGKSSLTLSIDSTNFNPDKITLVEVNFLPKMKKYLFEYDSKDEHLITRVKKRWSDFCEINVDSGTVFTHSDTGGRKLSKGSFIYSDTDYLLLCKYKPKYFEGLECTRVGQIYIDSSNIPIYRIRYTESQNSLEDFSREFCAEALKLIYRSKKPEIVALWPPSYAINGESIVINNSKQTYFSIKHNYDRTVIRDTGKNFEELELTKLNDEISLFEMQINMYNTTLSIDSRINEPEIIISNKIKELSRFTIENEIMEIDKNANTDYLSTSTHYSINSNISHSIIYIDEKLRLSQVSINKSEVQPFKIVKSGRLVFRTNKFIFKSHLVVEPVKVTDSQIDDFALYRMLKLNQRSLLVAFTQLDYYIQLFRDYPLSYRFLNAIKVENMIPVKVRNILIKFGGNVCNH